MRSAEKTWSNNRTMLRPQADHPGGARAWLIGEVPSLGVVSAALVTKATLSGEECNASE